MNMETERMWEVGEITKKSLTADGEYTYMVYNEDDESCEWCGDEDMVLE